MENLKNPREIFTKCFMPEGNPGIFNYRVFDNRNRTILKNSFNIQVTNNIAEYIAIVHAIKFCNDNGWKSVNIRTSSYPVRGWARKKKHNSKIHIKSPELYTPQLEHLLNSADKYIQENINFHTIGIW